MKRALGLMLALVAMAMGCLAALVLGTATFDPSPDSDRWFFFAYGGVLALLATVPAYGAYRCLRVKPSWASAMGSPAP